jgi:hypothetical protein
MVQGWRRYSWNQMTGIEPFEITHSPEQGIETQGNVVSFVKQKPQPNVDVSMLLMKKGDENEAGGSFIETFVTDDQGRFSFVSDVHGRWGMILSVSEKGKKKDHRILINKVFSPEPKRYRYADMQVSIAEKNTEKKIVEEFGEQLEEEDLESFLIAYRDSIAKLGINEKVHQIEEVVIKGKRNTKEREILRNRTTSVAYYDVNLEMDNLFDKGEYINNDIHELLINMNKNFTVSKRYEDFAMMSNEFLLYKQKLPLFIVNYKPIFLSEFEFDYFHYTIVNINAIKAIYINETPFLSCQYCTNHLGCCHYDFVIFIETYPYGQIPSDGAKGVRKTWLEGYSAGKEFYSPNYSELPRELDYRRTLYWNPNVTTDEDGKARIEFYNNSWCTNFSISAETVTEHGKIGVVIEDYFDK